MTSKRLGEMFKGDSADMCAGKFPLVLMGGPADTSSVRRRGARTPIGASGNSAMLSSAFTKLEEKLKRRNGRSLAIKRLMEPEKFD